MASGEQTLLEEIGQIYAGAARHKQVSKVSVPPNFTLKDQDGKTVSLSKFKGKPTILYFYPVHETPGWTKQISVPQHWSYEEAR